MASRTADSWAFRYLSHIPYRWFGYVDGSWRERYVRFRWAELTLRPGLACELIHFGADDDIGYYSLHLHLGFPGLYLHLPIKPKRGPRGQMLDRCGFSLDQDDWASVHYGWGDEHGIMSLPWSWGSCVRWEVLTKDGHWVTRDHDETDDQWLTTHPYTYVLRSGEVQHRVATVHESRMEWRWLLARKLGLPWPRKIVRSIDVQFDDEVGERTGTWKGGVLGCGYRMRPGETREQCLARMERERKL